MDVVFEIKRVFMYLEYTYLILMIFCKLVTEAKKYAWNNIYSVREENQDCKLNLIWKQGFTLFHLKKK